MRVDGQAAYGTSGTSLEGMDWVYFAVTYDGTKTGANVQYYIGDGTTLTADGLSSINAGAVNDSVFNLEIGNHPTLARNMNGFLDNIRVYGGAGTSGITSMAELTAAMQYDDFDPDFITEMPLMNFTMEVYSGTGEPVLTWESGESFNYTVLSKTNLLEESWATNVTETGTGTIMTYTTGVSQVQSFFRLRGELDQ